MKRHAKDVIVEELYRVVGDVLRYHSKSEIEIEARPGTIVSEAFDGCEHEELLSASIALEGREVSASLSLFGKSCSIQALSAHRVTCPEDWVGELSNLLMGALKNQLSEYNVSARLGLPVCVGGIRLQFISRYAYEESVKVTTNCGVVVVQLHFTVTKKAQWEHHKDLAALDEGEMCFF